MPLNFLSIFFDNRSVRKIIYIKIICTQKNYFPEKAGKISTEYSRKSDKIFFYYIIILCLYYIYTFIACKYSHYFTSRKRKPEKFLSKVFIENIIIFPVKSLLFLGIISVFPGFFPYFLLIIYFIFLPQNMKKINK